ncbi:hypothetical protein MSAN_02304300 [Mycena sanguinolenta]|uniref:Transposase n=1 Tax=Mycena sanguinolenta TaxID=230812 RepID=A0A8H6X9L2_9AGAR|nr:hypothetical protein MSAN_02304300 [Mycena sanguinolenta]
MDSTCKYCRLKCPTVQGLRSHLSQSKQCRQKHFEEYEAESSGDSDSDTMASAHELPQRRAIAPDDVDMDGLCQDLEPLSEDDDEPTINPPIPENPPNSASTANNNARKRPRATVEDVEDEDERWVQPFPEEFKAGARYGHCKTSFQKLREAQEEKGHAPWEPFDSKDIWELGHWLMTSGLSGKKIDAYLQLKTVREGSKPSFHNNRKFLQYIDALPDGPQWDCYPFEIVGDELDMDGKRKTEIVEMWCRDPVECVRELSFKAGQYSNREFHEMWTGVWWWEIQLLLPVGSTLVPIIIASDKTQLTKLSGDQQAWPVYITIGNIDKETRRRPSARATVLLGYIPVAKLEMFDKKKRSVVGYQLFHDCMRVMLASLKKAGEEGVMMDCADGFVRRMYLIIAAYIADYPEQCLVCCCGENSCPGCLCLPKCRGHTSPAPWRCPEEVLRVLTEQSNREYPTEFVDWNLRPINPFWSDFPHCNIFRSMTPDLLHELHNGVFGDHLVNWCTQAMLGGEAEVDRRFRAMTFHPSLRHFKKGISLTTQWTGREHKNMEKVFLGVLAGATDSRVQLAARGALDFIYYAHFETHCDESLTELDNAWKAFHDNKDVFIDLDIRKHFNISKLHKLKHYVDSIRSRGTADGFNSEGTERLHIDLAKVGYNASNRREYTRQMTLWLRRQERVHKFGSYLQWAVPGYTAPSASGPVVEEEADLPDDSDSDDSDDDAEDEDDDSERPTFTIAKKPPFPAATVASIVSEFAAPAFITNLERFLESKSIVPLLQPSNNSTFPVYKRFSLSLPTIHESRSSDTRDTVRAVKAQPQQMTPKGVKRAKAGQFDTVLVRTNPQQAGASPIDGVF